VSLGTWLVVGFVLVVVLTGITGMVLRYVLGLPKWRDVPLPGFTFKAAGPVDDAKLADALLRAIEAVEPIFSRDLVMAAIEHAGLRILVMETESWLNSANVRVGGEQMKNTLFVGPSLSALAHELIHYLQWAVEGVEDATHTHWDTKVWAADGKYRETS